MRCVLSLRWTRENSSLNLTIWFESFTIFPVKKIWWTLVGIFVAILVALGVGFGWGLSYLNSQEGFQKVLNLVRPILNEKGIIFDVGHGGGSFLWDQAVPAFEQGFHPNTISTDLHTGSMNGGMKDMANVMSKCLYLGMSMPEIIMASTWKPAQVINRPELGHITPGAEADVAVLRVVDGDFGYIDTKGWKVMGTQKIICELTLREGRVVWDLNGMSRPQWEK